MHLDFESETWLGSSFEKEIKFFNEWPKTVKKDFFYKIKQANINRLSLWFSVATKTRYVCTTTALRF